MTIRDKETKEKVETPEKPETPTPERPERHVGIVEWFSQQRGYGFISFDNRDFFVHWKDIIGTGFRTLLDNEEVTFEVDHDEQGRTRAINVRRDKESEMLYKRQRRQATSSGRREEE